MSEHFQNIPGYIRFSQPGAWILHNHNALSVFDFITWYHLGGLPLVFILPFIQNT